MVVIKKGAGVPPRLLCQLCLDVRRFVRLGMQVRGCEVDFGAKGFCSGTVMKAARSLPSKLYIKCVLSATFPFC